jgi:hypothetical protein
MTDWTPESVRERLREAAAILLAEKGIDGRTRRLLTGTKPPGPDGQAGRLPSPSALAAADKTFQSLVALDPLARRILWARAGGVRWWRIAAMVGRSERECERLAMRGLESLAAAWSEKNLQGVAKSSDIC